MGCMIRFLISDIAVYLLDAKIRPEAAPPKPGTPAEHYSCVRN